MNIEELKNLVDKKESNTLEFKKSTSQLKPAFETLCGFLNGTGGTVLIGVTDNGKVIGQNVTDATRKEIAREISKIEPPAHITIKYIPIEDGKEVIVLQVEENLYAPYVFDSRPYVRNESTTSRMIQHQYEQLLVKRSNIDYGWDSAIASEYTIDDLDHEEILKTVKEGIDHNRISVEILKYDVNDILKTLKLMSNGKLTNAAVVLYAKDVQPKHSYCMIRMARFKGKDKLGDFIDNQRVDGSAFKLIRAASDFCQRHLPIASFFVPTQIQRIDQPAVPALALREALVNAVVHRDYTHRAGPPHENFFLS